MVSEKAGLSTTNSADRVEPLMRPANWCVFLLPTRPLQLRFVFSLERKSDPDIIDSSLQQNFWRDDWFLNDTERTVVHLARCHNREMRLLTSCPSVRPSLQQWTDFREISYENLSTNSMLVSNLTEISVL